MSGAAFRAYWLRQWRSEGKDPTMRLATFHRWTWIEATIRCVALSALFVYFFFYVGFGTHAAIRVSPEAEPVPLYYVRPACSNTSALDDDALRARMGDGWSSVVEGTHVYVYWGRNDQMRTFAIIWFILVAAIIGVIAGGHVIATPSHGAARFNSFDFFATSIFAYLFAASFNVVLFKLNGTIADNSFAAATNRFGEPVQHKTFPTYLGFRPVSNLTDLTPAQLKNVVEHCSGVLRYRDDLLLRVHASAKTVEAVDAMKDGVSNDVFLFAVLLTFVSLLFIPPQRWIDRFWRIVRRRSPPPADWPLIVPYPAALREPTATTLLLPTLAHEPICRCCIPLPKRLPVVIQSYIRAFCLKPPFPFHRHQHYDARDVFLVVFLTYVVWPALLIATYCRDGLLPCCLLMGLPLMSTLMR